MNFEPVLKWNLFESLIALSTTLARGINKRCLGIAAVIFSASALLLWAYSDAVWGWPGGVPALSPLRTGVRGIDQDDLDDRFGQILEIWTRDRFAPMDIPLWAERDVYEVVGQERVGAWSRKYWIFRVERP